MGNVSLEERLAQMGRDLREELSDGKELSGSFFCHHRSSSRQRSSISSLLGFDEGSRQSRS